MARRPLNGLHSECCCESKQGRSGQKMGRHQVMQRAALQLALKRPTGRAWNYLTSPSAVLQDSSVGGLIDRGEPASQQGASPAVKPL